MGVSLIVALVLWRHALWQSVTLAATVFLLGATLASGQRDQLSAAQERGLTVRQWQRQQQAPDADNRLGRSRLHFLQLRERVLQRYRQQGLDGEAYAMVAAMSVGDKSAVSKDVRQSYNVSGAAHVLALSGLHMGIIYALLTLLTSRLRLRLLSQTVIVLSLWAFVFLVGMPPSAVRSATMLSLYALLSLGYRQHTSVNALAFTAIVILIVSPYTLFDIGFQLSFVSVLSILVWLPIMERWVPLDLQQRHRMVRWLWGMTAVSLAAQLSLLLRSLLHLLPADQLPGHSRRHADSLSCPRHASLGTVSRRALDRRQPVEQRAGGHQPLAAGEHRKSAALGTADCSHLLVDTRRLLALRLVQSFSE